jgi:hypothetical protein
VSTEKRKRVGVADQLLLVFLIAPYADTPDRIATLDWFHPSLQVENHLPNKIRIEPVYPLSEVAQSQQDLHREAQLINSWWE